jgi:hypothetical protein
MNQRIKELIKSRGIILEDEHFEIVELIVEECVSLFDGSREMKTVGLLSHTQVIERIEKHFGDE